MRRTFKLFALLSLACTIIIASCTKENDLPSDKDVAPKKAVCITDEAKLAMINSVKNVDGQGRLYEVNYTVDYKLDEVIAKDCKGLNGLFNTIAELLFDRMPKNSVNVKFGAGCSAFAVPEAEGIDFLMGRNYDFRHSDETGYKPIAAILVRTAPKDGKKSISLVDGYNLGYGQGFYENPNVDMSMLMGLPYAILDGINEDGFAIGVLALREKPTIQQAPGKPRIGTTVAMRLLLDRVSTVREAIELLDGSFNLDTSIDGNVPSESAAPENYVTYHYFMADATGDFAIVEYTYDGAATYVNPDKMEYFKGDDAYRYLTNFYVSDTMKDRPEGKNNSTHGLDRYNTLKNTLYHTGYQLSEEEAMQLLYYVSQAPTEDFTSQTQWSSLYNLSDRSLSLAILREYGNLFNFKVE